MTPKTTPKATKKRSTNEGRILLEKCRKNEAKMISKDVLESPGKSRKPLPKRPIKRSDPPRTPQEHPSSPTRPPRDPQGDLKDLQRPPKGSQRAPQGSPKASQRTPKANGTASTMTLARRHARSDPPPHPGRRARYNDRAPWPWSSFLRQNLVLVPLHNPPQAVRAFRRAYVPSSTSPGCLLASKNASKISLDF